MIRNAAHETCPKFICPRGLASCSFYILDREERFLEKKKKRSTEKNRFRFSSSFLKLDFGKKKRGAGSCEQVRRRSLAAALGRDY